MVHGTQRRYYLEIALIMVVGALLRLYRLPEQSLWLDEYLFFGLLPADTLHTHFLLGRALAPELCISPLFFLGQYIWAHTIGMSVEVLRLFPITISLAGIPLAYLLGHFLGGRFTAIVTALLWALSPQNVWYSQELRPYIPLAVLSLLSFYALLRASRDNEMRWWIINTLVTNLALWVYALGGLVYLVNGLFLLLFSRHSLKVLILWTLVQFIFILPWALWALQTPFVHAFQFQSTFGEIINAVVFSDVVSHHWDLLPTWKNNAPSLLPPAIQSLLFFRTTFDTALVIALALCTICALVYTARLFHRRCTTGFIAPTEKTSFEATGMLLLALLVPGTFLALLEVFLNMPFLGAMYIMAGKVSLYAFFGFFISRLPFPKMRALLLVLVVSLYAYQLALLLPVNTRTNYPAATAYIHDHGTPKDLAMCFNWLAPENSMGYYLNTDFGEVKRITTLQGACDSAYAYFQELSESERDFHSVWFAFPIFLFQMAKLDSQALHALDSGLKERGLDFSVEYFPGHWNLFLYKITVSKKELPPPPFSQANMPFRFEEDELLHDLCLQYDDEKARQEALYTLRGHIFAWPPIGSFGPMMESLDLIASGEPALGLALAQYVIREQPGFGMAYFSAGLASFALNDRDSAMVYFEQSFKYHPSIRPLLSKFVDALSAYDSEVALNEVRLLQLSGDIFFLNAMRAVCTLNDEQNIKFAIPQILSLRKIAFSF